jgi:short subunit dehydrogenase-like uncharacterized protein
MHTWLLYGAYGFTGKLIVAEAVRRGQRPVLAGRDPVRLAELANAYGLEWFALDLDYPARLQEAVGRYDLVLHVAGPFRDTAEPMVRACLAAGTHYLDITGELPVFEHVLAQDEAARRAGVALMSGVGFDIVPTDCLARYVADQLPDADWLETAVASSGGVPTITAGTAKSALGMMNRFPGGSVVRRDDQLVSVPLGRDSREIRFSDGRTRTMSPSAWGDLVTAAHTTGIPNVTSYLALDLPPGSQTLAAVGARLLALGPVRRAAEAVIERLFPGPDAHTQETSRGYLWAAATNPALVQVEAWLETPETYRFTALAALLCVERVLAEQPRGALTPAEAFGADLVLAIEGVQRFDRIPDGR